MPRDTSTDTIDLSLMQAYVNVIGNVSGWGLLSSGAPAVYPRLDLPYPQEPFPGCWLYIANIQRDYGQGTGLRRNLYTVAARIIGGPATPGYATNPEDGVYSMLNGVENELMWRSFLQDPTNSDTPFRYIDSQNKVTVIPGSRIQGFSYPDQGVYIGTEVVSTVMLAFNIGRLS